MALPKISAWISWVPAEDEITHAITLESSQIVYSLMKVYLNLKVKNISKPHGLYSYRGLTSWRKINV